MGKSEMTLWEQLFNLVQQYACGKCHGSGQCDDADLGDITFNQWKCEDCKGTGFANGTVYELTLMDTKNGSKSDIPTSG